MRIENTVEVDAPLDRVWALVNDIPRVAPCMPGAEVLERTGEDSYKVVIKVKVGPIAMQYRGEVEIVERDPATRTAVMNAKAKETRGQGIARATVRIEADGHCELLAGVLDANRHGCTAVGEAFARHRTPPSVSMAHNRMASASASLSSAGENPRARIAAITAALSALPLPAMNRLMVPIGTPW